MARCREDGASLAVLVVALDGFGEVNELYGHNVGDELLHDAAARLSDARRRSDTVARFAGDEFVVVCPYVASADLACQTGGADPRGPEPPRRPWRRSSSSCRPASAWS